MFFRCVIVCCVKFQHCLVLLHSIEYIGYYINCPPIAKHFVALCVGHVISVPFRHSLQSLSLQWRQLAILSHRLVSEH